MTYRIILTAQAIDDLHFWRKSDNKAILNKIETLLEDISAHPFTGIGRPEALRYELAGCWSRRINLEHRIVYRVVEYTIEVQILAMRKHYR